MIHSSILPHHFQQRPKHPQPWFLQLSCINFLPRFKKCTINFSSGAYFYGFRWFTSMKFFTSFYLVIHRSSCVIASSHYSLRLSVGLIVFVCCDIVATFINSSSEIQQSFSEAFLRHRLLSLQKNKFHEQRLLSILYIL